MALSVALPLSNLDNEVFPAFSPFAFRDVLGRTQSSPSPSVSSESSTSGISTDGSRKSESENDISLPSSPQITEKKPFEIQQENVKVPAEVIYKGRNILDLKSNIGRGWGFKYAHLPQNNMSLFLANRSQYHRLSGYEPPDCGCDSSLPIIFNYDDDEKFGNLIAKERKANDNVSNI